MRATAANSLSDYNFSMKQAPLVGVVMGSKSDYDVLAPAVEILKLFGITYEARVVSAHRTPDWLFTYAEQAERRGLRVIIAGAGGRRICRACWRRRRWFRCSECRFRRRC